MEDIPSIILGSNPNVLKSKINTHKIHNKNHFGKDIQITRSTMKFKKTTGDGS